MFELTQTPFGKYRLFHLHHPETGDGFSIVPGLGATLLELRFRGNNVLDGYQSPDELEAGEWGKSAVLFPFPNRLQDGRYSWLGKDYNFPVDDVNTGNAIHGFVRHENFELSRIELTKENAELSCQLNYPGHHPWYPFPFLLEITFSISSRNDFSVSFFVKNRHQTAIPIGLGWHPYFHLSENANAHRLQLPPCSQVDIDERMIPTGTRNPYAGFAQEKPLEDTFLDHCFLLDEGHSLYHLNLRSNDQSLALAASRSLFPFFQVFTPPHRNSIALEPMSCNINAFQNGDGLHTLPAGGDWAASFRIEYHRKD